eukprot:12775-Heterococcus_DN1.PRE.1
MQDAASSGGYLQHFIAKQKNQHAQSSQRASRSASPAERTMDHVGGEASARIWGLQVQSLEHPYQQEQHSDASLTLLELSQQDDPVAAVAAPDYATALRIQSIEEALHEAQLRLQQQQQQQQQQHNFMAEQLQPALYASERLHSSARRSSAAAVDGSPAKQNANTVQRPMQHRQSAPAVKHASLSPRRTAFAASDQQQQSALRHAGSLDGSLQLLQRKLQRGRVTCRQQRQVSFAAVDHPVLQTSSAEITAQQQQQHQQQQQQQQQHQQQQQQHQQQHLQQQQQRIDRSNRSPSTNSRRTQQQQQQQQQQGVGSSSSSSTGAALGAYARARREAHTLARPFSLGQALRTLPNLLSDGGARLTARCAELQTASEFAQSAMQRKLRLSRSAYDQNLMCPDQYSNTKQHASCPALLHIRVHVYAQVGKFVTDLSGVPATVSGSVTSLLLSNNCLSSLAGLQQFTAIRKLALRCNLLQHSCDLWALSGAPLLEALTLAGNAVAATPNYREHVLFVAAPTLRELDGTAVDAGEKEQAVHIVKKELAALVSPSQLAEFNCVQFAKAVLQAYGCILKATVHSASILRTADTRTVRNALLLYDCGMPSAQQDRLVLGARALAAAQHMQLLFVCHSELRAALYGKFACARARHLCIPWRQLPALDLPAASILQLLLGRDAPLLQVQVDALEVGGTGHHRHCCVASQQQQQQQAVALCERRAVIDEVCRVRLELEATGSLLQHKQHASSPVAAAAASVTVVQWSAAYAEVQRRQDEGLAEAQWSAVTAVARLVRSSLKDQQRAIAATHYSHHFEVHTSRNVLLTDSSIHATVVCHHVSMQGAAQGTRQEEQLKLAQLT